LDVLIAPDVDFRSVFCASRMSGPASNEAMSLLKRAEKSGRNFLNPVPTQIGGLSVMFKVLPLYLKNRAETEPKRELGPFRTNSSIYDAAPESGLRVTWFGHSSSLIEIDGMRVLIDPVWDQRASPLQWTGPKRFFQPTIALEDLPKVDVVLISHDHYDHLGKETVRQLARLSVAAEAHWVTSLGVGERLRRFGVATEKITELDWTESVEVRASDAAEAKPGNSLKLTAWPSRHFSGRGVRDRFTTLWSSFVIEGPRHRVFFGADSGWWDGFGEIAAQYERFDLTMLEIGAFHELWANIHLGPDGAARAFEAMGGNERAGLFLPIHWGLFNLALHAWRQPIERLLEIAPAKGFELLLPRPGEPTEVIAQQARLSNWWAEPFEAMHDERVAVLD
jgi:L-ascorbate metabolism protein UlaG (beta-lactamase superfamily)